MWYNHICLSDLLNSLSQKSLSLSKVSAYKSASVKLQYVSNIVYCLGFFISQSTHINNKHIFKTLCVACMILKYSKFNKSVYFITERRGWHGSEGQSGICLFIPQ